MLLFSVELKEEEHKEQIGKKELEVLELTRQLRTQDKEKQNEIIKLQIEVCTSKSNQRCISCICIFI